MTRDFIECTLWITISKRAISVASESSNAGKIKDVIASQNDDTLRGQRLNVSNHDIKYLVEVMLWPSGFGPIYIRHRKLIIIVPADALASLDARASAGAALTQKLDMCSSKVSWIKGDSESVFPDHIWSKMVSETSWCPATFRELNLVLTPVISHRIIVANKRCATQVLRYLVH